MFVLMLNAYTGKATVYLFVFKVTYIINISAQGNSPNDLSLAQTPDRTVEDNLYGQQTPISLERTDTQLNPDSDSLERRLLDHQNQQENQEQQGASSDVEASSLIKLDNGDVLYMREVNR
jgi:Ras-related GTP-binding protein C/D